MQQEIIRDRGVTEDVRRRAWNPLKQWKAIALITLVSVLGAVAWSLLSPKIYNATATGIVVTIGEDTDVSSALTGTELEYTTAASYESLAVSKPVAETVIRTLNLDVSPEELLQNVVADVPGETPEIHVTTVADNPELAKELADAWVRALGDQVDQLQRIGVAGADPAVRVSVEPFGSASVPDSPSSPRLLLNVALGVLIGLTLGFAYAYIRNQVAM